MRCNLGSILFGLVLLLVSSPALAFERNASESHSNRGIAPTGDGAAAEEPAIAPGIEPGPAAVPVPADKPASAPPPVAARAGVVLELAGGARVLAGQMFRGLSVNGVFAPVRGSVGVFVTPRFGLLAGAEIGMGTLTHGCDTDCSKAVHFSFPISAEYAFVDHMRGPYVDAGVVLLPTYLGSSADTGEDGSGETLKLSEVADANLGAGFRIPMAIGGTTRSALDIHLAANAGQFKSVEHASASESLAFDIDPAKTALHYSLALTVGWHFAP